MGLHALRPERVCSKLLVPKCRGEKFKPTTALKGGILDRGGDAALQGTYIFESVEHRGFVREHQGHL